MKNFRKIVLIILFFIIIFFLILKFYKNIVSIIPESIKSNVPESILVLHLKIVDFINVKRTPANFLNNAKFLPETHFGQFDFKQFSFVQNENDIKSDDLIFSKITASEKFFIDIFEKYIVITTFDGNIFYFKKDRLEIKKEDISLSQIKTNLKEYPKLKIIDSFIDGNNLYISTYEFNDQSLTKKPYCDFKIFHAKLNLKIITFEQIFSNLGCTKGYMQGGRMQKIYLNQSDGLLFSMAANLSDYPTSEPQDENNNFGKIVFLNLSTGKTEVFSKGHRNPQGLYVEGGLILSTEHGPLGGDEINKIIRNKNYGWPIASYGNYYYTNEKNYLKDHDLHGFEEPIYTYIPAIGISEIVKIPEKFIQNDLRDIFFVSSLIGRSLHLVKFDKNYSKVIFSEKIFLNHIIRDLKYIDEFNLFILSLGRKNNDAPSKLGILISKENN